VAQDLTEANILSGAKRNRMNLLRYLLGRPAPLAAMTGYKTALVLSSRAEDRLKLLVQVNASAPQSLLVNGHAAC
jgi:hypothetical protein